MSQLFLSMLCVTEYGFEVSARMTVRDWRLSMDVTGRRNNQQLAFIQLRTSWLRLAARSPASSQHHMLYVTRIITDICSPTTSLQNKIQSLFFSFSIVYLHLSSCVLHTGDGSDREARSFPLSTSCQRFCHIMTSS